jgi:hypothetical protein
MTCIIYGLWAVPKIGATKGAIPSWVYRYQRNVNIAIRVYWYYCSVRIFHETDVGPLAGFCNG